MGHTHARTYTQSHTSTMRTRTQSAQNAYVDECVSHMYVHVWVLHISHTSNHIYSHMIVTYDTHTNTQGQACLEGVWKGLGQSEERSSRNKTRSLQPESLLDSDSKPHHVIQTLKTLVSTLVNTNSPHHISL